jgi:hypothetical protein
MPAQVGWLTGQNGVWFCGLLRAERRAQLVQRRIVGAGGQGGRDNGSYQ